MQQEYYENFFKREDINVGDNIHLKATLRSSLAPSDSVKKQTEHYI